MIVCCTNLQQIYRACIISDNYQIGFLICGPPASGKTTFLYQFITTFPYSYVLSLDQLQHLNYQQQIDTTLQPIKQHIFLRDIYKELHRQFTKDLHRQTRKKAKIIISKLIAISPVIVEDELLTAKQRRKLQRMADRCLKIFCKCNLIQALQNNSKRQRKIPQQIIKQSFQRMDETDTLALNLLQRLNYKQNSMTLFKYKSEQIKHEQQNELQKQQSKKDDKSELVMMEIQLRRLISKYVKDNVCDGKYCSKLKSNCIQLYKKGCKKQDVLQYFNNNLIQK